MFLTMFSRIIPAITLVYFGIVESCNLAPISQHNPPLPICNISPISIDFVVNPTLSYLRPTEIGLNSPILSENPEYFAASAGAIAMTDTLNELFQNLQTIHYGPNTLVNIPFPVILNQPNGSQCSSTIELTIIPQYDLAVTDIGVSDTYVEESLQGITNNREACQICSSTSPPFTVIHGTFNNPALYDVTSQVCNAFNVPTIAVSITDRTFQELYPEAAASAQWSALASIGPTQIGNGLYALMNQFGWHSLTVLLDPTNTAQANEVIRGFQLTGLAISSQFVDYYGTTCTVAIDDVSIGMLSIIYLDLGITRVSQCIGQILSSGLLASNFIVIWGPTLMSSVNNNFTELASQVGVPLSSFSGTFSLQVRTQPATYYPLFEENVLGIYSAWNDSSLPQTLFPYPTSLEDNANSVVLASQGIYGFLANNLCSFANQGLTLNLSDSISSVPVLVQSIASQFASILSGSQLQTTQFGTYGTISSISSQNWDVQINIQKLNITPSSVFFYYTENSGYWSQASNMAKWYHDGSGNSVTIFDAYNLRNFGNSAAYPIGSYYSRIYSWIYNSSSTIIWPNSSALWQYISGHPGDTPPLTSLNLNCLAGFSCSSVIVAEPSLYLGFAEIVSYSTYAILSDNGAWKLGIQCSGGGGTLFYTAEITSTSNPDSLTAWSLALDEKNAEIQLSFDAQVLDPNKWAGGNTVLSFSCFDANNFLNGTLEIFVTNDDSQYTPGTSAQLAFVVLNSIGIALTFIGAVFTIFYRHRRPIYSSSIPFLLIAWLGFAILFASGIVSILPVTGNMICQAKSWLFNYGFALVMGSLVLKTFHIHKIFNNDKLIIFRISFWQFMLSLSFMLAIVTIVMLVWENNDAYDLHRNSSFQPYCVTGSWVPFHIIAALDVMLILTCLWLSYQIRGVHHDYNESKCIGFIVYNTAIWGITWWVLSSQISISASTLSLLTSLFIFAVSLTNIVIFFSPKFFAVLVEETQGLVVNPNRASNRLAHSKHSKNSKDSNEGGSGVNNGSIRSQKSLEKTTEPDFILPPDGKEALKHAKEKLFETARKWRTNEAEHARLKRQIQEREMMRVQDSELINSWMGAIRNILTSGQMNPIPKDAEGLIIEMWRILSMRGSEIIEEAERHESARRKREGVVPLVNINLPKSGSSTLDFTTTNLTSSPILEQKSSLATMEMVQVNPASSSSITKPSLSGADNLNFNHRPNSVRHYI
jgi:hypothetical protein